MAIPLKYATAGQEIPLGYFVDSTDGDTAETALTIANTDIKLWKNGATTLANKNSGGATHMAGGVYYCTLDATDTNTYGPLVVFVHVSGALSVRVECVVMEVDAYDALYAAAGTGHIEADVVQVSGDATAANNLESDYDGTGYNKSASTIGTCTTNTDAPANFSDLAITAGTGLVDVNDKTGFSISGTITTLDGLNDPSTTAIADAVWDEAKSGHVGAGSFGEEVQAHALSSEISALNDPTAAAIADAVWDESTTGHVSAGTFGEQCKTDIDAILTDTNSLNDTKIPDTISLANINSEVDTALSDIYLDDLSVRAGTAQGGAAGSITLDSGASATDNYYDGQVIVLTGGTGAGQSRRIDTYTGSTKVATVSPNWATSPDGTTTFTLFAEGDVPGSSAPTAAQVADAVWDEAASGHTSAGSFGQQCGTDIDAILVDTNSLNDTKIPDVISLANINAEVDTALDTAIPGTPTANSINERIKAIDDKLPTGTISDFDESTDSVTVADKTGFSISGTITTLDALNDPTAAAIADAVWDEAKSGHTGAGSFGEEVQAHALSSEVSALNDLSAAQVNAEVVDAINTDTYGEPAQGAPPASASLVTKVNYLYKAWRNKSETTATTISIYDDAGTTVDHKSTISDDATTFTKAEYVSGP